MEVTYNKTYYFNRSNTLEDLLNRKDLIELPMFVWKEILTLRFLVLQESDLYKVLKTKIEKYDTSSSVNSFIIGDTEFWLDKNTRVGLMHLANCSTSDLQLVLGDKILTVSVDTAKNFLEELERYAAECYLTTQKHLIAIKQLKTVEDVINYDYTKGYPDKIIFNG